MNPVAFATVMLLAIGGAATISEASREFNRGLWASGTILFVAGFLLNLIAAAIGIAFL